MATTLSLPLPLAAQAKVKATALALPAVERHEVKRGFGYEGKCSARRITIEGDWADLWATTTGVYRACGKCVDMTGFIAHYAGISGGICYQCAGQGITRYAEDIEAAQRKVRSEIAAEMRRTAQDVIDAPKRAAIAEANRLAELHMAWDSAIREDAERTAKAATAAQSRWVGQEGERITFTGRIVVSMPLESMYGTRMMVVAEGTGEDAGVTIKTIGTSEWHFAAERGETVTIKATVKDHGTYNDTRQTIVIRPKAA